MHVMAVVPVLIAGGGPAGLAAAAELTLHGIDCVVIEPRVTVSHRRPRAKTTSIRTMEHLRRWGLADSLRAAAPLPVAWSQRVTFCTSLAGERITDFDGAFGLTTSRDDRFAEAGQQVPQPVVEDVLRRHLQGQYLQGRGLGLRFGCSVTGLTQHEDRVVVQVSDGSEMQARYVLGCDGASGVVREQIGARYTGQSHPHPNYNVMFRAPSLDTHLGPAVQYWIAGAAVEHEVLATDPWTPRMLIADRFTDRRVFLVGESAHVNPPFGGHGFNTSVGDAVNIAWKIAAVEQGWAGAGLLDSYEPERRGVVAETVASAAANTRLTGGNLPADAEGIQRGKYAEFHSLGLVLGYSYAGSPVIQAAERPVADVASYAPATLPGARLPHWWLPDGSSLYDRLGSGFTLVGPAPLKVEQEQVPLSFVLPPASYPWHEEHLLVRPDQHIAWRGTNPAPADIEAALAAATGSAPWTV
jgi:2-polyprenyl-6-methoxyphenol hydroxylase-like FAD-dependent oxidoreductase